MILDLIIQFGSVIIFTAIKIQQLIRRRLNLIIIIIIIIIQLFRLVSIVSGIFLLSTIARTLFWHFISKHVIILSISPVPLTRRLDLLTHVLNP